LTPDRQARQERAQAAALRDIEAKAERRREQSSKLRKLRLDEEEEKSLRFKRWREQQPQLSD